MGTTVIAVETGGTVFFSLAGGLLVVAGIYAWSKDGLDGSFTVPTFFILAAMSFALAFGYSPGP